MTRPATAHNKPTNWQWDFATVGSNLPNENPSGLGIFSYNLRFPGQYFDTETGLFYNSYRDYDPRTGRYIESDPIGLLGGINTYSYVAGNPLSYADPRGLAATGQLIGQQAGGWLAGILGAETGPFDVPIVLGGRYLGGLIGNALEDSISRAVSADTPADKAKADARASSGKVCPDDNDPCDIVLDKGQLKSAGIRGLEHEVKADELGTNKNLSKFDLCGCTDGRVVLKTHGCKGPMISVTNYRWK
jgi:RHS repeat-associated protein